MAPVLPSNLTFAMGDIERKVDMSLDDIIKLSKKGKPPRAPIKSRNMKVAGQLRKDALQRSVGFRSSALRQGKLAEARARNGNSKFLATKAAARTALSTRINPRTKRWNRKSVQGTPRPFVVAAGNMKISFANVATKNGTNRRPPAAFRRSFSGNRTPVQPRRLPWGSSKMAVNNPARKLQTLDSRFASLREEWSQYGSKGARRR